MSKQNSSKNENTSEIPLPGIEHIVVLMLENRSFDNMLGGLYPDKTPQDYDGLTGNEGNSGCGGSDFIKVWQAPVGQAATTMPYPDPGELFTDMNEQIFGNTAGSGAETMQGFACNYTNQPPSSDNIKPYAPNIMQYYAPGTGGNIPVTSALAQAYAVSDQWFASGPVQTLANRIFAHCATPSRWQDNEGIWRAVINNTDIISQHIDPDGAVTDACIFELLDNANYSWKVYYHDWPLSALVKYVDDNWHIFEKGNVFHINDDPGGFYTDVVNDSLPTYSFIEPRYTSVFGSTPNSNHPGGSHITGGPPPINISDGEILLQSIYMTLYNKPELFEKTLLIVIYDEHGGLYDHVTPPAAASPFSGEDSVEGFNYDRYGVRVPAIFINPYISSGTIFRPSGSTPFDHTTIISTLRAQFNLGDPLTPRDGSAPTLDGLINSGEVNTFNPEQLTVSVTLSPESLEIDPELLRAEPPTESINATIRKSILNPKNQLRVKHIKNREQDSQNG